MTTLMGSTEQRLAVLKISAQMNKRVTKEDPVPTADTLIGYATELEEYIKRGWRENPTTNVVQSIRT